jgi:hypothetical protein
MTRNQDTLRRNRKGQYIKECEFCTCPDGCACEGNCFCGTRKLTLCIACNRVHRKPLPNEDLTGFCRKAQREATQG